MNRTSRGTRQNAVACAVICFVSRWEHYSTQDSYFNLTLTSSNKAHDSKKQNKKITKRGNRIRFGIEDSRMTTTRQKSREEENFQLSLSYGTAEIIQINPSKKIYTKKQEKKKKTREEEEAEKLEGSARNNIRLIFSLSIRD